MSVTVSAYLLKLISLLGSFMIKASQNDNKIINIVLRNNLNVQIYFENVEIYQMVTSLYSMI